MDSENIIHWKSVTDNPPPPEVFVWLTNWKSFGLGKRVSVKKEEFEAVVFDQ